MLAGVGGRGLDWRRFDFLDLQQDIPYFKEVVIMATCCDACGHRDNEVKSGGGIEPKGRRITLVIEKSEDMTRDVLKVQINSVVFWLYR